MRCNNCGFDNAPERTRCEKCNALLKIAMNSEMGNTFVKSDDGMRGTIKGQQSKSEPRDCPNCGRPIVPGSKSCNSCDYVFAQMDDNDKVYKNKGIKINATIDPYQRGFVLKPVATQYEDELSEIRFKASEVNVKLGRENLESGNATISKEQAELEYRNGKWYIKNLSEKKSTFVFAGDYIEINDGDIILMHDIHANTIKAVPGIISMFRKKGYVFVAVSSILEIRNQRWLAKKAKQDNQILQAKR